MRKDLACAACNAVQSRLGFLFNKASIGSNHTPFMRFFARGRLWQASSFFSLLDTHPSCQSFYHLPSSRPVNVEASYQCHSSHGKLLPLVLSLSPRKLLRTPAFSMLLSCRPSILHPDCLPQPDMPMLVTCPKALDFHTWYHFHAQDFVGTCPHESFPQIFVFLMIRILSTPFFLFHVHPPSWSDFCNQFPGILRFLTFRFLHLGTLQSSGTLSAHSQQ